MHQVGRQWRERVRGTERARVLSDAVITFVAGVALIAVGLVDTWSAAPGFAADRWWFLLPLAAVCVVMLGKGRRPLLALGAGLVVFAVDALMGGSIGVMLGLVDLIYSAAVRAGARAVRRLEIGVGLMVLATASGTFVALGDVSLSASSALLVFALLGTPLWWGRNVRQQTELAALASARAQDLTRLAELREQELVRTERTRMAGDLHDALASHLSAIAIHAEGALASLPARPAADAATADPVRGAVAEGPGEGAPAASGSAGSPGPARAALMSIRASSVAALREMRSMIELLRTGDETRTSPARLAELDELLTGLRGQGMAVHLTRPADLSDLPAAVDQAAYRIVQEALTNVLKHARGAAVGIGIDLVDGALRIEVTSTLVAPLGSPHRDDDAALDDDAGSGVGMLTMRERAEALGGSFTAGPQQGSWHVHAHIPVEEAPCPSG